MKVTSNGTEFTYTSYKDGNDNDEKMWIAIIRTINGIKMDISGTFGYLNFTECQNDGYTMYGSTKKKLDDYILEVASKNCLYIRYDK
tara:strand:+ start:1619 stop:1879 length:261 start_codon:yes stop_codon:yes gene_type:complete